MSEKLTNLKAVLAEFGVGFVNNFTVEDNPRYYYSNNKLNVIPAMGQHEITQSLLERKMYVILPVAMALQRIAEEEMRSTSRPSCRRPIPPGCGPT